MELDLARLRMDYDLHLMGVSSVWAVEQWRGCLDISGIDATILVTYLHHDR